jgi:hypothetical protein
VIQKRCDENGHLWRHAEKRGHNGRLELSQGNVRPCHRALWTCSAVTAQATQTSIGLFCESVLQIERFLAIRGKSNEAALAIVNDEFDQGHRVCGIGRIEFLVISVAKMVDSWDGEWEIVKIDVRAMYMGLGPVYTKDLIRYTAFLIKGKTGI